jgi:hypothetical protein
MAESVVKVRGDTSHAVKELEKLDRAIAGLNSVSAGAAKALAAITAAGAAMGFAVMKSMQSIDELAKSSRQLGMTSASMQALRNSAELAGIGADELTASMFRLQNSIGEALIKGTGPAKDALDRLGIPLEDISRLPADQQLKKITEELRKIPDNATKTAMAIDLLGKQGPRMLEVADAADQLRERFDRLGISLSEVDVAAVEAAGDAITEIQQILGGAFQKAVADLAPIILAIATSIREAIEAAGGFEVIWGKIKTAIRETINVAVILVGIVTVSKLAAGALALYRAIVLAGGAMAAFNAIAKRNPLILALVAAIALGRVLKVDVVGMLDEFLGISEKAAAAQEDIKIQVENTGKNQENVNNQIKAYNEQQRKALEALDQSIVKLEQQVQYQRDVLALGETEARIRRTIAEESEKLARVGLTLNSQQQERLAAAIREEQVARNIGRAREDLEKLEQDRLVKQGRAFNELLALEKKVNDARVTLTQSANAELQAEAERQLQQYKNLYNQQVQELMIANSRELRALENKAVEIRKIDTLLNEAKQQGYDEDFIAYRMLLTEKQRLDREYNDTVLKLQADRIQQALMMERGAVARRLQDEDRAVLQKIGAEERQRRVVSDRIEFEKKSEAEKYKFAIDQGAQMFSALGAQNKRAFEAAKAFNIANAIMNTYLAATKALATYPPPFNFIAAAAAIGMGLAQVATIRSQQYSGREKGGPIAAGMPYLVGEAGPEIIRAPAGGGTVIPNNQLGGGAVNVNFTINAIDTQGFDELLVERRGVITTIIQDAMLEQGQRF